MKILVDENIAYGIEAFSTLGEVVTLHGKDFTNQLCRDADAIITRSITKVDENLLAGTNVKFAATATIGLDHYDTTYLNSAGIKYVNAPGCNSSAVRDYVLAGLANLANKYSWKFADKSFAIIGVGNIGSKVEKWGEKLFGECLLNDPPREKKESTNKFVGIDEALQADVITLHVPLNKGGEYNTVHLLDEERINSLKPSTVLINACRGAVVDNNALLHRLKEKNDIQVILDVWENEPDINEELLSLVDLGTAHIAGYSLEGKVNGTVAAYNALCSFVGVNPIWKPSMPVLPNSKIELDTSETIEKQLLALMEQVYSIEEDSKLLKKNGAAEFNDLRKKYKLRRDLENYEYELKQ